MNSFTLSRLVLPLFAGIFVGLPVNVVAQNAMPAATGATAQFAINGFELTGDIPLSTAETSAILAPFIGPKGSLTTLQQATSALEAALKARGYALHRVALPPQELGKKVTLNIVKFVIGKVTIEGASRLDASNIRGSIPEIREGQAPNFKTLAVQTTIANENPGKQIQVGLKESDEADKIDVNVLVKEGRPWIAAAGLSNTGSESTGRDRLALVFGHSNLFNADHQISAAFTSSLEKRNAVKQFGLNYKIPLYRQGAVVGLSYTNSDVVGNFGSFTSNGAGTTAGINISRYMPPDGGYRGYWTASLDNKQFNVSKINDVPVPGQMDRTSRPLTLGYTARVETDKTIWGYNAELAMNLPGGNGNVLEAYQTEDGRIRTEKWKLARAGVNYAAAFAQGWLWSAKAQFQFANDALIAGEQLGLGGANSVRGTAERVVSGDSGMLANLELMTPELMPGLRLLTFYDAGWLRTNNAADSTSGRLDSDQLSSAGLGLRYGTAVVGLTADWGRVLSGSNQPPGGNPALPKAGDSKLHLALTARF